MFGMGFTEILFIAVIAILFLGPDKLPSAMVEVAKFFRNTKKTIMTVKDSLEEEMNINEIKQEALAYKKELLSASDDLKSSTGISEIGTSISSLSDDLLNDDDDALQEQPKKAKKTKKSPEVTFEKKPKKEKKTKKEDVDV